jgi:biofilm PGA synthesis N-glycosyltransferase PgaC
MYVPVVVKFALAFILSSIWTITSIYLAAPWYADLTARMYHPFPESIVLGLAIIPGWAMSFIIFSLLMDKRPRYVEQTFTAPPLTVLIAAYNEEGPIFDTLMSVLLQQYPAHVRVVVIDDGSTDRTAEKVLEFIREHPAVDKSFELLRHAENRCKAAALCTGLETVTTDLVITIDADSSLYEKAIENLSRNIVLGPKNTAAVAGNVLVRNSRKNIMTKLQEWDYFHGIAIIKRVQSLYQGTLVAQGALSIYRTEIVKHLDGWPHKIGEDIVLTWGLLGLGYRIGYAENAFCFTLVPETYRQFFRQRKRWSRGLIEAFKTYPATLFKAKMNFPFIWYNLFFPLIDSIYLIFFLPGLIAAVFFHNYLIVGLMTALLLPLAIISNGLFFWQQRRIFTEHGLKVRINPLGFVVYMLAFQAIMAPATVMGYLSEMLNLAKKWGTK